MQQAGCLTGGEGEVKGIAEQGAAHAAPLNFWGRGFRYACVLLMAEPSG